jgi:hypothetical protein
VALLDGCHFAVRIFRAKSNYCQVNIAAAATIITILTIDLGDGFLLYNQPFWCCMAKISSLPN